MSPINFNTLFLALATIIATTTTTNSVHASSDYAPQLELRTVTHSDAGGAVCKQELIDRYQAMIVAEVAREAKNAGVIDDTSTEYSDSSSLWNADEWGDLAKGDDDGTIRRGLHYCPHQCLGTSHPALIEYCLAIPCAVRRRELSETEEQTPKNVGQRMLESLQMTTVTYWDGSCDRLTDAVYAGLDLALDELFQGDDFDCMEYFMNFDATCKFVKK